MTSLAGKRIVLGISGGIAAYKAIEICRLLTDLGAHVSPVLTEGAQNMIGVNTISALASEVARTSLFGDAVTPIPHTSLGRAADAVLIAPATARVIADISNGRSADLLTATVLATKAPVVLCPAMHSEMWENVAVQDNISLLVGRGVHVVGPSRGALAGGDSGIGRLADPQEIVDALGLVFQQGPLRDKKVLVTAGGTREPIDVVRFIGNRSSGKQGHAFARVAAQRGADVTLVTTKPTSVPAVKVVAVSTAAEMHRECEKQAVDADLVVMAAAVADFRPKQVASHKIKKSQGIPTVELEPTVDILAELGSRKPRGQVLVGFAAETEDVDSNAQQKLRAKNLDMVVVNDILEPGAGFDHDTNVVRVHLANKVPINLPLSSKTEVANAVLNLVEEHFFTVDKEQI